MRRLPQALIIGAKKGGTRAMLEFLRVHPSIRGAGPEVHFFNRHYDKGIAWYRWALLFMEETRYGWYMAYCILTPFVEFLKHVMLNFADITQNRSKMPTSLEGRMTVEKTPAYFTSAGVPQRVAQDLPGVKLLLVVRDPVTRALSDYVQGMR